MTEESFDTLPDEAIAAGHVTDAYFDRTEETLEYTDRNPTVIAEVTADQFPTGEFEVLAGTHEVAQLLEGLPVDVDALPEGTLFDSGPVLTVEGPYRSFLRFETSLLGMLSQASAYATRALAARQVAGEATVVSFGTRHVHPALATVVERSSLVGGFDGISNVAAGERLEVEATGTMPHALLLVFGADNTVEAWTAFHEAVDEDVPRIALCDTFTDEVVESLDAANALGDALDGVRLDTTGSRRGDFRHITREVRWKLDEQGFDHVELFLSGGIGLEAIDELKPYADGFGVGSYITDAPPVDFALDIVEVDGEPTGKRGKLSGAKRVVRTPTGGHVVEPADSASPTEGRELLEPLVRDGEIVRETPLEEITEHALSEAQTVEFDPWNHAR